MDARQRATFEALCEIDGRLGGLFELAWELYDRADKPGIAHVLGHCGREISSGVLRELSGVALQLPSEEAASVGEDEKHRLTIAAALDVPPQHPLVTAWLRIHRAFAGGAHYGEKDPSVERVREAWEQFSSLLFSRIGPYFDTQTELDTLLKLESPRPSDLTRLRPFLVRPVRRRYFFERLTSPDWLQLLAQDGAFGNPPERIVEQDGRWRLRPWPEGECLVRFAGTHPDLVTGLLSEIPTNLENLLVWDVVVRAALAVPIPNGVKLAQRLGAVLERPVPQFIAHRVVDLAERFAKGGDRSAFELSRRLMGIRESPPQESDTGDAGRRMILPSRTSEWMLEKVDAYELKDFLAKVIPHLERIDPSATCRLLLSRLQRAVAVGTKARPAESAPGASLRWCNSVLQSPDDDVRAQLAVATASVARRLVQSRPTQVTQTLTLLHEQEHEVFRRIWLAVLVVCGRSAPEAVDEVVSDPSSLDPPYGASEVAELLRTQFPTASQRARRLFRYNLERGPNPADYNWPAVFQDADNESDPVGDLVRGWQRRRLRWFRGVIPEELQDLARELGVGEEVPSLEQQALDEVGSYSHGVYSVGDTSPWTVDELRQLEPETIANRLRTWQPTGGHFGGPSRAGVGQVLKALVAQRPPWLPRFIGMLPESGVDPLYVQAVLEGLREVVRAAEPLPWADAFVLIEWLIQMEAEEAADTAQRVVWASSWARPEALRLLAEACERKVVPEQFLPRIWTVFSMCARRRDTWKTERDEFRGPDDVVMAGLNMEGGQLVEMLVRVAWSFYQSGAKQSVKEGAPAGSPPLRKQERELLVVILDGVMREEGVAGAAAQARLGEFAPFIAIMAPGWFISHAEALFGQGLSDPLMHPAWTAYLGRGRLFGETFSTMRPWYTRTAEFLDAAEAGGLDPRFGASDSSMTRHLAHHIVPAFIWGIVSIEDPDRLVERVFSRVPGDDLAHAYWEVFRGWSDSKEAIPEPMVRQLEALWEWRLQVLEAGQGGADWEAEADGLGWFLRTPYVPDHTVLRLGSRTLKLGSGHMGTRRMCWPKLGELSASHPSEALEMAEVLIEAEFSAEDVFLDSDEVAAVLRSALKATDSHLRDRARRIVNRLGDRGWVEFGKLLSSEDEGREPGQVSG